MAKKKLLRDFLKHALSEKENRQIKGGKSYVPGNSGSYGYINWDDVDIRNNKVVSQLPATKPL